MTCPKCGFAAKFVGKQTFNVGRDPKQVLRYVRMYECKNPKCGTSFVHPDDRHKIRQHKEHK